MTITPTTEELDRLEGLYAAAPAGDWHVDKQACFIWAPDERGRSHGDFTPLQPRGWGYYTGTGGGLGLSGDEAIRRQRATCDFVVEAHNALPRLLAAARALPEAIARAEAATVEAREVINVLERNAEVREARLAHAEAEVARLREAVVAEREATNAAYTERNRLVAFLAHLYPSGLKRTDIPGWDAEWHGCVYIDLPTGQASWHYHDSDAHLFAGLPPYAGEWDGHTTDEKYERISATRLSPPEGAGRDRVEAVARALCRDWYKSRGEDVTEEIIERSLRTFRGVAGVAVAALAVLPSEAEGATRLSALTGASAREVEARGELVQNLHKLRDYLVTAGEDEAVPLVAQAIAALATLPLAQPTTGEASADAGMGKIVERDGHRLTVERPDGSRFDIMTVPASAAYFNQRALPTEDTP